MHVMFHLLGRDIPAYGLMITAGALLVNLVACLIIRRTRLNLWDLLILEGMYGTEEKMPQALKNHHMLYREAAEIARKTQPGSLLLTHFSTSIEDPEEYLPETRTIFERTWAAKDGETVTLRYPEGSEKAWTSLS